MPCVQVVEPNKPQTLRHHTQFRPHRALGITHISNLSVDVGGEVRSYIVSSSIDEIHGTTSAGLSGTISLETGKTMTSKSGSISVTGGVGATGGKIHFTPGQTADAAAKNGKASFTVDGRSEARFMNNLLCLLSREVVVL